MKPADLRGLLVTPVFLYAALVDFLHYGDWNVPVLLVLAAMALPVLELVDPKSNGRWFVPAGVLAGLAGVGLTFSNGTPTGLFADVGGGVLLGTPITVLLGLLAWRRTRLAFLLGVEGGLAVLLVLLATGDQVAAADAGTGPGAWLDAFSTVNTQQFDVLLQWLQGNINGPSPPLAGVNDPIFVALGLVAAVAVVLALLERPPHAGRGPAPWDPHFSRSAGIVPLVAAAVAGLAFEYVAGVDPAQALLTVAVGAILALVGLVSLTVYTDRRRDRPRNPSPIRPA